MEQPKFTLPTTPFQENSQERPKDYAPKRFALIRDGVVLGEFDTPEQLISANQRGPFRIPSGK